MPWVTELRKVHRAFRRMALRFCYNSLNPDRIKTQTHDKRTLDQALAHQNYTSFLANGVTHKGITQAMADGPFAITAADTAWLKQGLASPAEGAPKIGYWTGSF